MFDFYSTKEIPCFGVAGNFTGHLEQAGEAKDFLNVKTKEVNAPKAIFPTYIPIIASASNCKESKIPDFLKIYPFDCKKIIFPKGESKLQIEPECAVIFDAKWEQCSDGNSKLVSLTPICFGASNDCSIRKEGAKKISQKKNWGESSKGYSSNLILADSFDSDSIFDRYRIASFLIRGTEIYAYGEDSAIRDYSYFYKKLTDWLLEKFNGQKDEGPAEDIHSYLLECSCPEKIMVSVGATRYTDWGQHNFLQSGDKSVVVLYPQDKYSAEEITAMVKDPAILQQKEGISALVQTLQI
ncbi:MAG: DUF5718 family protein [Treponema sp.]|nr:DUF5718 family protein [Treponema sp.]